VSTKKRRRTNFLRLNAFRQISHAWSSFPPVNLYSIEALPYFPSQHKQSEKRDSGKTDD